MSIRFRICLLLLSCLVLAACKHKEPESQLSDTAILSPQGGVYHLEGGLTLVVPQGAVAEETEVKINYSDNAYNLGYEARLTTDIYGMISCQPEGLRFERPIEVRMPSSMPATDTTAIFLWNPQDSAWTITDFGLTDGNEIVFTIEHFCHYAAIPQEYLTLFDIFDGLIDIYVKNGETSEAELNEACTRFCKEYMDEALHFGEVNVPETYENGNPQLTCVGICGYLVRVIGQDEEGGEVYQGVGRYKEASNDGVIYNMTDEMLSEHWKNEKKDYSHKARTRMINIYAKPTAIDLAAKAQSNTVEKGKITKLTISTSCDGSMLPNQPVSIETNSFLDPSQTEIRTDENGNVEISVIGKEVGSGLVKVKTVSPADASLVSETEVTINVTEKAASGERYHAIIEEELQVALEDHLQYAPETRNKFATVVIKSQMDYESDEYGLSITITDARITDVSVKYMPELDTVIQVSQLSSEEYTSSTTFDAVVPIQLPYTNGSYTPTLKTETKLLTMNTHTMSRYYADDGQNISIKTYTWDSNIDFIIQMPCMLSDWQKTGTRTVERQYYSDPYEGMIGNVLKYDGEVEAEYTFNYNGDDLDHRQGSQAPNLYGTMVTKSTITITKVN